MPEMFTELVRYRGLLAMLAWRDIRVRYKQSLLGVGWAILMPLVQTLVLWAVVVSGAIRIDKDGLHGMPLFMFVLAGMIPWTLFNGVLAASVESLTRNSRLVTKIYFPREVFPLGTVGGALVDFGISLVILVPFYIYYCIRDRQVHPSFMLLALPVVLLVQIMLVSGLAMIISMANLFFRDVKYIMTFVMQLLVFTTNVFYPLEFKSHPALKNIFIANPMIAILDTYRDCLMGTGLHNPIGLAVATVISAAVLIGGWIIFHRAEFKFAEYI